MIDWGTILTNVVLTILGFVTTGISGYVAYFLSTKIKDEKLKKLLTQLSSITTDAVKYVYQTYVEDLKGTSAWNKEAMDAANQKAIEYIKGNLTNEMIAYITANGKDITDWAKEQIEIVINNEKNK